MCMRTETDWQSALNGTVFVSDTLSISYVAYTEHGIRETLILRKTTTFLPPIINTRKHTEPYTLEALANTSCESTTTNNYDVNEDNTVVVVVVVQCLLLLLEDLLLLWGLRLRLLRLLFLEERWWELEGER